VEQLNERLITKVLKHIKAFPHSYDQDDTASSCDVTKKTPCGAIACFGGWAVLLAMKKNERSSFTNEVSLDDAQDVLGLTGDEANYLFATTGTRSPRRDYRIIIKRLKEIRTARSFFDNLNKDNRVDTVSVSVLTKDRQAYLNYEKA
jgi:hypothetical protein